MLKIDQTSSEEEDEPEITGESQSIEVPRNESNTNSIKVASIVQTNFDYLDCRENEERLERLKS